MPLPMYSAVIWPESALPDHNHRRTLCKIFLTVAGHRGVVVNSTAGMGGRLRGPRGAIAMQQAEPMPAGVMVH